MLPVIVKIAAVVGAAHLITKKRRRKSRHAGSVGHCSKCGKRAALQRVQGMVGACCSSCAHGGACETEDTGASESIGATRRHRFWDQYYRTAPVGSRFRRRY